MEQFIIKYIFSKYAQFQMQPPGKAKSTPSSDKNYEKFFRAISGLEALNVIDALRREKDNLILTRCIYR